MIKGMTGFGHAQLSKGDIKAIVEVKSVNHRYFDLSFYLPTGFAPLEDKIRQVVQQYIARGRVTVSVKITNKPAQSPVLNRSVAKQHLAHIKKLKTDLKLKGDVTISEIIRLPGVLDVKESMVSPNDVAGNLEKCVKKALTSLVNMRKREGRSLVADIGDKLKQMAQHVKKIKARAAATLKDSKKKLTAEEFKSFQKSIDINEELARLSHYIDEVKSLLRSTSSIGKKMDFIAQEMQRETNTIGSKLQDKVVSNAVISLKSKIEKIREQAQNVE